MDERQSPLTAHERSQWPARAAGSNFADAVTQRWLEERSREPEPEPKPEPQDAGLEPSPSPNTQARRPSWWWMGAGLALAAGLGGLWLLRPKMRAQHPASGQVVASVRETVSVGERGVVVAESGARVQWTVDDEGRARLHQSAGSAFYRVERGGEFRVRTPLGEVQVVGTCFSIDVVARAPRGANDGSEEQRGMKERAKNMMLGASLASAVVVTVYEGKVAFAGSGEPPVLVAAGEKARVAADGTLEVIEAGERARRARAGVGGAGSDVAGGGHAGAVDTDRLRAENRRMRAEVARLRARIELDRASEGEEEFDEEPTEFDDEDARIQRCVKANRGTSECSFLEPDRATLMEMARCAVIRVDMPNVIHGEVEDLRLPPTLGPDIDLEDVRTRVLAFRTEYRRNLQAMFVEAGGGTPDTAREMPAPALEAIIEGLVGSPEIGEARRRLAHERAGLRPAPDLQTAALADRYVRLTSLVGDEFERALAEVAGPVRARFLRELKDGWGGNRSVYGGECRDIEQLKP